MDIDPDDAILAYIDNELDQESHEEHHCSEGK